MRLALAFALLIAAAPARAQLTPVTVGMTGTTTDVGLYVAHKKGFFSDEKLDVKLTIFDSAARMITLFASGALDVGGGGPSAGLYNAAERKLGMKVVAEGVETEAQQAVEIAVNQFNFFNDALNGTNAWASSATSITTLMASPCPWTSPSP